MADATEFTAASALRCWYMTVLMWFLVHRFVPNSLVPHFRLGMVDCKYTLEPIGADVLGLVDSQRPLEATLGTHGPSVHKGQASNQEHYKRAIKEPFCKRASEQSSEHPKVCPARNPSAICGNGRGAYVDGCFLAQIVFWLMQPQRPFSTWLLLPRVPPRVSSSKRRRK